MIDTGAKLAGVGRRAAILALALAFGGVAVTGGSWPHAASAQVAADDAAQAEDLLSQAQLEQLLAPVALYPDELLMQVLMAATYPIEIVQATRWLQQDGNAKLTGDALAKALEALPWDPSVKSLVPFPDVLKLLNDQLEWTQQLGDAVLAQQDDVFNAIQVLRFRAQEAGNLESGPQQTITVVKNIVVEAPPGPVVVAPPPQIITIAPTQPNVVFVPAYNPNVVFGAWPHPAYPPIFLPPPPAWGVGNAILTGLAFATSVAVVGSLWGWARPGWGRGRIDIDVNRVNNINVNRNQIIGNTWRHDVNHRQGVAYRGGNVDSRFRPGSATSRAQSREQFRGRLDQAGGSGGGLASLRPGGGDGDRPGLGSLRPGGGDASRPGLGDLRPGGGGDGRPGLGGLRPGGDGGRPDLGALRPGGGTGGRPDLGSLRPGGDTRPTLPGGGDRPSLADRRPDATARPSLPSTGNRPSLADRAPGTTPRPSLPTARPGEGSRPSLADRRPESGARPSLPSRPSGGTASTIRHAASGRPNVPAARPTTRPSAPQALQGIGQGDRARAAAQRGQASRQAQPSGRAAAARNAAAGSSRLSGRQRG